MVFSASYVPNGPRLEGHQVKHQALLEALLGREHVKEGRFRRDIRQARLHSLLQLCNESASGISRHERLDRRTARIY